MDPRSEQMAPFFSIIVPVYNSERYLEKTIECLQNQIFKEIEILVDDGSSDSSPVICDRHASEDRRIKVIHQRNAGICAARDTGIDQATGVNIGFCDNDDEIDRNCFQILYAKIKESEADIVRFRR